MIHTPAMEQRARNILRFAAWPALLAVIGVVCISLLNQRLYFLTLMLVYGIAALGLNVPLGYARILHTAQAGFVGVGAYAFALLVQRGVNAVLALGIAVLIGAGLGATVGAVANKVRLWYFLIITIGVQLTILTFLTSLASVTGGAQGMRVGTIEVLFVGNVAAKPEVLFFLAFSGFGIAYYMAERLRKSRLGRAIVGLGERRLTAAASGIPAPRYQIAAVAIAGMYAGFAGALYAPLVGYLTPQSFSVSLSLLLITMIVVGGLGSNAGVTAGVVAVMLIDDRARSIAPHISAIVYGVFLMVVVLVAPGGLASLGKIAAKRLEFLRRASPTR